MVKYIKSLFKYKNKECELSILFKKHPFTYKRVIVESIKKYKGTFTYCQDFIYIYHNRNWGSSTFSRIGKIEGTTDECIEKMKQEMFKLGFIYLSYVPINRRLFVRKEELARLINKKLEK
jgi:hypothetical protein